MCRCYIYIYIYNLPFFSKINFCLLTYYITLILLCKISVVFILGTFSFVPNLINDLKSKNNINRNNVNIPSNTCYEIIHKRTFLDKIPLLNRFRLSNVHFGKRYVFNEKYKTQAPMDRSSFVKPRDITKTKPFTHISVWHSFKKCQPVSLNGLGIANAIIENKPMCTILDTNKHQTFIFNVHRCLLNGKWIVINRHICTLDNTHPLALFINNHLYSSRMLNNN